VDTESAIIIGHSTEVQVKHLKTGQRLREWIPFEKLKPATKIQAGDLVVYDEWLGTVYEVFDVGKLETETGKVYTLGRTGPGLEPGGLISILPDPMEVS
jgi:ubiquitin-conjugating enzyme E2 O